MALKLRQLHTFVAVCQERSFTAAGVAPTAEGKQFYERVSSILRNLSTAEEELRTLDKELMGSVVVGVMPTFSRSALPTVLGKFANTYPHVELKIIEAYSSVLTQAVISNEVDFAIVPPEKRRRGFQSKRAATDREFFVTGVKTPRQNLEPVSLKSAGPLKLVMPSAGNSRRTSLDSYLARTDAQVEDIIELDGMMGTLDFISQSDWVAILPGNLCFPDLAGDLRKVHPITDPSLTVDYVLIEPDTRALSPAARLFSELLIKRITEICTEVEGRVSVS